jgi:hypothetical protein
MRNKLNRKLKAGEQVYGVCMNMESPIAARVGDAGPGDHAHRPGLIEHAEEMKKSSRRKGGKQLARLA